MEFRALRDREHPGEVRVGRGRVQPPPPFLVSVCVPVGHLGGGEGRGGETLRSYHMPDVLRRLAVRGEETDTSPLPSSPFPPSSGFVDLPASFVTAFGTVTSVRVFHANEGADDPPPPFVRLRGDLLRRDGYTSVYSCGGLLVRLSEWEARPSATLLVTP